jgi:hypothetical protein
MCGAQRNKRIGKRNIAADNRMKTDLELTRKVIDEIDRNPAEDGKRPDADIAKAGDDLKGSENAKPLDIKAKIDEEELTIRRRAFPSPEIVDYPDVAGVDR